MLHIKSVKYLSDYKIWIAFDDGTEGQIDLQGQLHGPVFDALKDKAVLRKSPSIQSLQPSFGPMAPTWHRNLSKPSLTTRPVKTQAAAPIPEVMSTRPLA